MRIIWVFALCILISGCQQNILNTSNETSKVKLVNELRSKVTDRLKNEYGLIPFGSGSQMMHQIEMISLSFIYLEEVDIHKGRALLVASVNEFISAVNGDDRIRPYLGNYPFESKNIEILIFLKNPNGTTITQGKFCIISSYEGLVKYDIRDSKTDLLKTVYTETFEEAVKQKMLHERKAI